MRAAICPLETGSHSSHVAELMQAILERYHEEQVWSDKVGKEVHNAATVC